MVDVPEMDRRRVLRLGLLTAGGAALAGGGGILSAGDAVADTGYNLFRGATSQSNESNFSDSPELVTYAASGIRGGLWVHNSDDGSVENGSYSDPFHRGDWGHNVRRVRLRSRRSFRQPMSVVVTGRTLWYDPKGGQTIGGIKRSANGGLKVMVGHHSNDYNYVVLLIRETGYITIYREYAHEYKQLAHVHYPTPIETYRTFKISWNGDRISVYRRMAEDNSDDRLIVRTAAGSAPSVYDGVTYDNKPIGMYLDGAGVRMSRLTVWQG
jgi:hypothetical protein